MKLLVNVAKYFNTKFSIRFENSRTVRLDKPIRNLNDGPEARREEKFILGMPEPASRS